jgi:hypothetical protein
MRREDPETRRWAEEMRDQVEEFVNSGEAARLAYKHGLLEPSREQKRTLLRAIGAHVLMYPVKHEYTQANNGKRWDLQISVPGDDNGGRYRRILNGGK